MIKKIIKKYMSGNSDLAFLFYVSTIFTTLALFVYFAIKTDPYIGENLAIGIACTIFSCFMAIILSNKLPKYADPKSKGHTDFTVGNLLFLLYNTPFFLCIFTPLYLVFKSLNYIVNNIFGRLMSIKINCE